MNTPRTKVLYTYLLCCLLPIGSWEAAAQSPPSRLSHQACFDLLEQAGQFKLSGLELARAFAGGEIVEPVLIRRKDRETGAEYSFQDHSGDMSIETLFSEGDLKILDSTSVARFFHTTSTLTRYHFSPQGNLMPAGETNFTFRGAGNMPEARRLGDNHVEVTKPDLAGNGVPILLVATRKAMDSMELEEWEGGWGDRSGDSRIKREIIWWELTGRRKLQIHPAFNSFDDLARRLQDRSAAKDEIDWASALKENLDTILAQGGFSLIVVSKSRHVELVKAMRGRASETVSGAVVDVVQREKLRRRRVGEREGTGKDWALVHFSGLAAVMPKRIAFKIRSNYRQSSSSIAEVDLEPTVPARDTETPEATPVTQQTRSKAREAQSTAIHAEAARYSFKEMQRGYKLFRKGYYASAERAFNEATERAERERASGRGWGFALASGLEAWNASLSASDLDGSTALFSRAYLSWDLSHRTWISASYAEGEADFTVTGSTTSGSIEEADSEILFAWYFPHLRVGVGYRHTELATRTSASTFDTASSGPMVFLRHGRQFGQSRWGYYGDIAYMFEDIEDNDGAQEQINAEGGFRWDLRKNVSINLGYRYKEYGGEGSGITFDGPVVNIAYIWWL